MRAWWPTHPSPSNSAGNRHRGHKVLVRSSHVCQASQQVSQSHARAHGDQQSPHACSSVQQCQPSDLRVTTQPHASRCLQSLQIRWPLLVPAVTIVTESSGVVSQETHREKSPNVDNSKLHFDPAAMNPRLQFHQMPALETLVQVLVSFHPPRGWLPQSQGSNHESENHYSRSLPLVTLQLLLLGGTHSQVA